MAVPTYTYMNALVGSTYGDVGAELAICGAIVVGIMGGAAGAHFLNWQKR